MTEASVSFDSLIENGEMEAMCWEDDDTALRMAASNGRHPYDDLTSLEKLCFDDIAKEKTMRKVYLFIRNKILQHWYMEPNVEVTWENVVSQLPDPYNSKSELVRRILLYLIRYGYINYGCFHRLTAIPHHNLRKKVVVIGGGMAGIAAAKQLESFGMEVVVLESSNRVGGRILTKNLGISEADKQKARPGFGADLGVEQITGYHGNPFIPIIKQLSCTPVRLSHRLPFLYDEDGKLMEPKKVDLIKAKFFHMSTAIMYLVNVKEVTTVDDEPLDLKTAFEDILEHCEIDNLNREGRYWENYHQIVEKVQETITQIEELSESARMLEKKADELEKMKAEGSLKETEAELISRFQYVDMCRFNKLYDAAKERRATLTALLKDIKKNEPSDCYMNDTDKKVLDWFFAHLEGTSGATLDQLPAEFFKPDIVEKVKEANIGLKEGFEPFITRLAKTLDQIHTNSQVTGIRYTEDNVVINYRRAVYKKNEPGTMIEVDLENEDGLEVVEDTITADAVICAVPLGVLKMNLIKFDPPLPGMKKEAVERMGFGCVNKVVLVFEKPFWNTDESFFGHLNPCGSSRGEFYLFSSVGAKPVLSVLMAGTAAQCEQPNEVIVNGAMTILKNIFGTTSTPKEPKEAIVTRWQLDQNFFGTHSFIQKGATSAMYDVLAEPIAISSSSPGKPAKCRVFFAGEHTCRSEPATLKGAWLSGVRAAAEFADQFVGQPFLRGPIEDYVDLSDDDGEHGPNSSQNQIDNDDDIQII